MNKHNCTQCKNDFMGKNRRKGFNTFCSKECSLGFHRSQLTYEKVRGYNLKHFFGISLEEYNKMSEQQNGLCAICEKPEKRMGRWRKLTCLAVDHDHTTGKVRGLLCKNCNQTLGQFEDDTNWFKKAITYIELHKE